MLNKEINREELFAIGLVVLKLLDGEENCERFSFSSHKSRVGNFYLKFVRRLYFAKVPKKGQEVNNINDSNLKGPNDCQKAKRWL